MTNREFIIEHLEEVFVQSTSSDYKEGLNWYPTANKYAETFSEKFKKPIEVCAGLISVLSPQKEWFANLKMTEDFLESKGIVCKHTTTQATKAYSIYCLNGKTSKNIEDITRILNGRKTTNFFHNILTPLNVNFITLDAHMGAITLGQKIFTKKEYLDVSGIMKVEALKLGLVPSQYQAILWKTWKRVKLKD